VSAVVGHLLGGGGGKQEEEGVGLHPLGNPFKKRGRPINGEPLQELTGGKKARSKGRRTVKGKGRNS